jgi:hypothetical protein
MIILFWIAYVLTILEFLASPINTLRNSEMHINRLREVKFPLPLAKTLAVVELIAVAGVTVGLWIPVARLVGGIVLALCFAPFVIYALRAKRPAGDSAALLFFMACALITALY